MKDVIKVLVVILPLIKELVKSVSHEADDSKKRRILRILKDKDPNKLERLSRILNLDTTQAEIIGFTDEGVIVNESFIVEYQRMERELRK